MKRLLISWYALNNDFIKPKKEDADRRSLPEINPQGPTSGFHRHFYEQGEYFKHILLTSKTDVEQDNHLRVLQRHLNQNFRSHPVEPLALGVSNVINLEEILAKTGELLESFSDYEIDIFISPGTPTMQVAWYLHHMSKNLKTRLIQTWLEKESQTPKMAFVNAERDVFASTIAIKQVRQDQEGVGLDYHFTPSIDKLYQQATKIALTDKVTVLIQGPSGSGKEHLARHIHQESPRADKPYVPVNCSAFNDELLRSELFGHIKGAFTGAHQDKDGILKTAQGGTVFLDEIGDISPFMQQSLLRVLQVGQFQRVGDSKITHVDVRFIAATNADLIARCEAGTFRWDLFYRLAVVELEVPSLLERGKQEIGEYLDFFINKKAQVFRRPRLKLQKELKKKLTTYTYPGNLRELENLVERLYVMAEDGVATLKHLPARILHPPMEYSLRWQDIEKAHIEKVLRKNDYNQNRTQEDIGYGSINTLRKKIKEYNIEIIR